jgi:phage/plasmid-associated DNA primase
VQAIRGLQRVMERGRFELPGTIQTAREQYRENLDTVRGWVSESARLDPSAVMARGWLYSNYRTWAKDSGRIPVSAARFYTKLREGWPGRIRERKLHGSWEFLGISLR